MIPFPERHVAAFRTLQTVWDSRRFIVIGAAAIARHLDELTAMAPADRLETRYQKFRSIGRLGHAFTDDRDEAVACGRRAVDAREAQAGAASRDRQVPRDPRTTDPAVAARHHHVALERDGAAQRAFSEQRDPAPREVEIARVDAAGEEAEGEAEAVTSGGDETEESEADTSEIDAYRTSAVDPGDFKPAGDYSFEVTTLDGKSHKISSSEEADNFAVALDKNPELISASQFVAFNRGLARMERLLEAEQWAWKNQKEAFAKEQAVTETRNATLSQWDKEIKYLRERGDLPTITSQFNNADWADAEIAKEPAVKETIELFDWMEGENGRREKVGLEPIKSVLDAFEIREAQTLRQELKGTKNKAIKTRQAKGAMVGGNAPHVPSNTPKDTIIGEGGSLNDLVTEFYNG